VMLTHAYRHLPSYEDYKKPIAEKYRVGLKPLTFLFNKTLLLLGVKGSHLFPSQHIFVTGQEKFSFKLFTIALNISEVN